MSAHIFFIVSRICFGDHLKQLWPFVLLIAVMDFCGPDNPPGSNEQHKCRGPSGTEIGWTLYLAWPGTSLGNTDWGNWLISSGGSSELEGTGAPLPPSALPLSRSPLSTNIVHLYFVQSHWLAGWLTYRVNWLAVTLLKTIVLSRVSPRVRNRVYANQSPGLRFSWIRA